MVMGHGHKPTTVNIFVFRDGEAALLVRQKLNQHQQTQSLLRACTSLGAFILADLLAGTVLHATLIITLARPRPRRRARPAGAGRHC